MKSRWILSKGQFLPLLPVLSCVVLGGCAGSNITTVVQPDGSISRKVEF